MNEDAFPIGKRVSIHAYVGQIEMCQKHPWVGDAQMFEQKKQNNSLQQKNKLGEMDKLIPAPRTKGCQLNPNKGWWIDKSLVTIWHPLEGPGIYLRPIWPEFLVGDLPFYGSNLPKYW